MLIGNQLPASDRHVVGWALRNTPVEPGEGVEFLNIFYGKNIAVLVQLWHNSLSGAEMKIILAPRKIS
jgi:hypothetical protein